MQNNDIKKVNTQKSIQNELILNDFHNANYNTKTMQSQVKDFTKTMNAAATIRNYSIQSLYRLGRHKKMDNIKACAAYIKFKEKQTPGGELLQRIDQMFLCKDRFCLFCAAVKAGKTLHVLNDTFKLLQIEDKPNRFRFITLTVPNVGIEDLRTQINAMSKAFNALNARYTKQGLWIGYYKSLEISYNTKTNTYHPHLHIIADGKYIPQKTLSENWYSAAVKHGVLNIPPKMHDIMALSCYIEQVLKPWELCKYVVKPDTLTYATVYDLIYSAALKGVRDNACGGSIKVAINQVKDEQKKHKTEDKQIFDNANYIRIIEYLWNGRTYDEWK